MMHVIGISRCAMRVCSFILALFTTLLTLASCGPGKPADARPAVVCTIFSYYDAARAIGGDKVRAEIILPRGQSPHDYQSTPQNKTDVYDAALYVKNGLGLDDRFDGLLDGSKAKVLTIAKAIDPKIILQTEETPLDAGGKSDEDETQGNPHIWLDPHVQMAAAEQIRDALIELDPADAETFKTNAAAYLDSLKQLDSDFATAAAGFKIKDFIGFHSAYEYLAHRYGLHQIASIEEVPGSGLSAAQAQKIIDLIQKDHIQYIAVESAFPEQAIKLIQQQTGVQSIVLQPLETYDKKDDTYVSYMRANLQALKTALGTKN
jgi:ABC-type Zn uptake system ZnuABC Zn-binding protein ZnuA